MVLDQGTERGFIGKNNNCRNSEEVLSANDISMNLQVLCESSGKATRTAKSTEVLYLVHDKKC